MSQIPTTIGFLIGVLVNLGIIYAAYAIFARKQCTKAAMLQSASIAAGGSALITALTMLLPAYIPAGCDLIAAIMLTYHCGRSRLKIERKPALLAALTYFGLILVLCFAVALLLVAAMNAGK